MLVNVKMSKIVGILTFISRLNVMLSWIEHEKSFITLRPDINLYLDQDDVSKPCMLKFIYGDLTPARLNDLKEACRKEVNTLPQLIKPLFYSISH